MIWDCYVETKQTNLSVVYMFLWIRLPNTLSYGSQNVYLIYVLKWCYIAYEFITIDDSFGL